MNHQPTLRVIKILETVAANNGEFTSSDIARRTSIPPSTLTPILQTLAGAQFLRFDTKTMRYHIGLKHFLSGAVYAKDSSYGGIAAVVESMAKSCAETAHFCLLEGGDVLYVVKAESLQPIRMYSQIGRHLPAYATAVGKALLSQYTLEELEKLYPEGLQPLTEHTIIDMDELHQQLAQVKDGDGFAYEWEESNLGIMCIARPLFQNDEVVAAISIVIPTFRYNDQLKQRVEDSLTEAADTLEELLPLMDRMS